MEFNKSFFLGVLVGMIVVFVITKFIAQKSGYTVEDFPDTLTAEQADAQFKKETADIAEEMSQTLKNALMENKSTEEIINITWSYADTSNKLNKDYAAYKIRNNRPKAPDSP